MFILFYNNKTILVGDSLYGLVFLPAIFSIIVSFYFVGKTLKIFNKNYLIFFFVFLNIGVLNFLKTFCSFSSILYITILVFILFFLIKNNHNFFKKHLGVCSFILGIILTKNLTFEVQTLIKFGESFDFLIYKVYFYMYNCINYANCLTFLLLFFVFDSNIQIFFTDILEKHFYFASQIFINKIKILTNFFFNFNSFLNEGNFINGWVIRYTFTIYLNLLWLSFLFILKNFKY